VEWFRGRRAVECAVVRHRPLRRPQRRSPTRRHLHADRDSYIFEKPVTVPHEGRQQSIGFIDLFKRGHFILEAKQGSDEDSSRLGTAKRGQPAWHIAMQDAFGQALKYARAMDAPPPFLLVTDVGYCFDLHASTDGRTI